MVLVEDSVREGDEDKSGRDVSTFCVAVCKEEGVEAREGDTKLVAL